MKSYQVLLAAPLASLRFEAPCPWWSSGRHGPCAARPTAPLAHLGFEAPSTWWSSGRHGPCAARPLLPLPGSPKVWGTTPPVELGPARTLCSLFPAAAAWPRQSSHLSFLLLSTFLNEEGCSALRTYKWLALTCQAWSLYFTRPIMNAIFLSKICIPPFLKSNDSNFFPSAHFLSVSFNGTCETDRRRDEKWKRAVD